MAGSEKASRISGASTEEGGKGMASSLEGRTAESGMTRREFAGVLGTLAVGMAAGVQRAWGQAGAGVGAGIDGLIEDLVAANRILVQQGVIDGYGHVSARDPRNPNRYLQARDMAPGLVTAADILVFDLDSNVIDGRGRHGVSERFIHGEIYKARADVKAVVHCHTPALVLFGDIDQPLEPMYHMASFVSGGVPVFDVSQEFGPTNMLISDGAMGRALTKTLGQHAAALLKGHGAVVVGKSLPQAVGRSVYLKIDAEMEQQAIAMGKKPSYLSAEQAEKVGTTTNAGQDYPRDWEMWKREAVGK